MVVSKKKINGSITFDLSFLIFIFLSQTDILIFVKVNIKIK
jgi:hypothetical protein